MKRNMFETLLGAAVLLIAGLFFVYFYKTADMAPTHGYNVTAAFSRIDGLETGSPVRLSGVKVGRVTGFSLDDNYQAVVTMNIDRKIQLPTDTAAVIASQGLLDGKFLALEPGADDEFLQDGDRIAYTQSTPGLEQLLGQVVFSLTNQDKD